MNRAEKIQLLNYIQKELGISLSQFARDLNVERNTLDRCVRDERELPSIAITAAKMLLWLFNNGHLEEWRNSEKA